ncbi:MAG TPA: hypothetical protein VFI52_07190 [Gemmatimonadaceae bacterium]|nr:hypothetical protein [Gemmatimonadaceae bacterium]
MPMSVAVSSRIRCALLLAALVAPAAALAQGRADARGEQVVVTTTAVRIRTAPSIISLSTDEYGAGVQFRLAPEDYQSKDWFAIEYDGRILYVPRYAAVLKSRAGMHTAAPNVMQAGEPTAMSAPTPAAAPIVAPAPQVRAPQPAAARVATREPLPEAAAPVAPSRKEPVATPAAAERVAATEPARKPQPAPSVAPAAAAPVANTPAATFATAAPAPAPAPATEHKADAPPMRAQHGNVSGTLGFLGSVTPIKVAGVAPTAHIAGASFINLKYRGLGIYGAPEIGQGGGYKSTLWGGGLSLDLIDLHLLHATALGGYAQYSETPDGATPAVTQTMSGYSVGGLVSLPIAGPLRLAYRGQYVTATVAGTQVHMTRHSFGLVF